MERNRRDAPAQAVGKGWINAVPPDDRDTVFTAWQTAAGGKREFSYEFCFRASAGKTTWVFCRAQANLSDAGLIEGYFGTIIDITERKGYEEEIRKLNAELEERVARRTMQLSVMSEENDKKLKEISLLYRLSNTILSTIEVNKLIHLILTALTAEKTPALTGPCFICSTSGPGSCRESLELPGKPPTTR